MTATLRLARRELLRAKGRSLLVLLMVLLPVAAVVALDTLVRTADVGVEERLPRELGPAEARLEVLGATVQQDPAGERVATLAESDARLVPGVDGAVRGLLPAAARVLEVRESRSGPDLALRTSDRRTARVTAVGVDLRDAAARGPFRLVEGDVPDTTGEVAVSPRVRDFGVAVGDTVDVGGGQQRVVVGVVDDDRHAYSVTGLPASLGLQDEPARRAYVSGAPVTWQQVRALNRLGVVVLSRAVVLDPPPASEVPLPSDYQEQAAYLAALVGLVAVVAVLEVVLLAGPAFAVGARRQRRSLALLLATGGEPRDVRRVVLAQGLLLGATAASLAVGVGLAAAALLRAPLTRYADAEWGRFEVSPRNVLLVAVLGAGTAVLAAVAPAVLAARQPVVEALQGRRASGGRSTPSAAVGAGLLLLGAFACYRALGRGFPELWVMAAAVPTVLGAALLAPAALRLVGRCAGRLPLALRFAARDADRQRGRTAPAVAAITAVVAGVVALGTAAGSDLSSAAEDVALVPVSDQAVVALYAEDVDYPRLAEAARAALPHEPVALVPGVLATSSPEQARELVVCRPDEPRDSSCAGFNAPYGAGLGSPVLAGAAALEVLAPRMSPAALAAARAALGRGEVLTPGAAAGGRAEVRVNEARQPSGQTVTTLAVPVRTAPLEVQRGAAPALAVVPDDVARALGGARTVGMVVGGAVDDTELRLLDAAVRRVDTGAYAAVERTPAREDTDLVLLLLGLGAGTLVLAGSVAATSLALTEARPDLVTLGEVGAAPRLRRSVAAGYALVLTAVGAALGCAAGLVPGVAGAVALNRGSVGGGVLTAFRYGTDALAVVDVPWSLVAAMLVALPLVTAAVAGLALRTGRDAGLLRRSA
jgi:putative ABC transport system permease protein